MTRPTRTSYSALTTFEACPLAYKLSYLDKIDTPSGAAADRGTRLHKACERFINGEIEAKMLPLDFAMIKGFLVDAKHAGAKAEEAWLVDHNWNYQEVENGDTRFKAVVDIHYVIGDELHIWDLKTGRKSSDYDDQLNAYATMGFSRYPDIARVYVKALYLEGFDNQAATHRAMLPYMRRAWEERWQKLFLNESWEPTPGPIACRWCSYPSMGLCDSKWSRK